MPNEADGPTIILIGAPSGAGKTSLSLEIVGGRVHFLDWIRRDTGAMIRSDIKSLPHQLKSDCTYLIECSTQRFDHLSNSDQWLRLLQALRSSDVIVHVTLKVSRWTIVKQYLRRMYTGPKRISPLRRVFRLSKYRSLFMYVFTRQIARGYSRWQAFGQELKSHSPSRVMLVLVERQGRDYRLGLVEH